MLLCADKNTKNKLGLYIILTHGGGQRKSKLCALNLY